MGQWSCGFGQQRTGTGRLYYVGNKIVLRFWVSPFYMPLVLVQNPVIVNEGYKWKDIEGEQYHFPNQYKNRCVTGTPFVYYRGTRRPDRKRAAPEYFGHGRIGEVWRDETISESRPKKDWAWYCGISDYTPFRNPVPAKDRWRISGKNCTEPLERWNTPPTSGRFRQDHEPRRDSPWRRQRVRHST